MQLFIMKWMILWQGLRCPLEKRKADSFRRVCSSILVCYIFLLAVVANDDISDPPTIIGRIAAAGGIKPEAQTDILIGIGTQIQ